MKNYLEWGTLLLLILLVLTIEATFAVNETGPKEKINVTRSDNITNAITNIAALRNLTITTNVSKIKNLTVSINLPTLWNETKKMANTTAVAIMLINSTNATTNENDSQKSDNLGGCPCNSQG
jgi:hypothetical protein